jgi:hypothetical protein
MKQTVLIQSIESKQAQNGRNFSKYKTNLGTLNCFDAVIIPQLANAINQTVDIEVMDENGYKNIKAFYGFSQTQITPQTQNQNVEVINMRPKNEILSYEMSYVKDLFLGLKEMYKDKENSDTDEDLMSKCIELTIQMRDGLKL